MDVEYIDHMGDDLTVVNSARVSFDKESDWEWQSSDGLGYPLEGYLSKEDERLINYLASHNHWTPFSHCTITLRETVPIFVARERFRHTVGFTYNEVSRRYVEDSPVYHLPKEWRKRPPSSIKQGSSEEVLDGDDMARAYSIYDSVTDTCNAAYSELLGLGVAPEQARMLLPQNMMTSYYVTGSLAAFARAYMLRSDSNAQKEIQDVALKWNETIKELFPHSWAALTNSRDYS